MGKYKVALSDRLRVGYVLRRYPNYSETFIVNEILAHEAAGLTVEIFALRPPKDTHFQDLISKVRGSVSYLPLPDTDLATEEQAAGRLRANPFGSGLQLERFPFEAPQDRSARVVAVGRLVEKKGFGDLIDACAILAGRGRVFSCDIIGAGPLEADLRARIERLGLEGTVELTGPRP